MWSRSHHGPARVEVAIIAVDRFGIASGGDAEEAFRIGEDLLGYPRPGSSMGTRRPEDGADDVGVRLPSPPRGLLWGPTRKVLRIPGTTSPLRTRVSRTPGTRTGPLP